MIKVNVFVKDKNWNKYISSPENYLKKKIKLLNNKINLLKKKDANFSILLAGNKDIKLLNNKFRKKNKTTDVLSFPFYNSKEIKYKKKLYLGDVILNFYKIKKNNFEEEFNKLWIHGFLHLIGHKHYTDNDFYKMNKLENKIFKKIIC